MGQMNMGEFLAFGPSLAGAPELRENASLNRPVIGRREQRRGAPLVVEREPLAADPQKRR